MYPIWEVPYITGGMIIAAIATFHILPSHLTIGGMWFNVFVESKAYRDDRPELMTFVKKYSLLLLIFSYVFGSLTGVGIWFATSVVAPRGISALIHNYVWGWAAEWVFFMVEVSCIFIYYYTIDKIDKKTHLKIGWIFAIASWITMIIITGILAFMLTPGKWLETGNFFLGFFNESYFPHLLMRTGLMVGIAALYALAVASVLKNTEVKDFISRTASTAGIGGIVVTGLSALWYLKVLPDFAASNLNESLLISDTLKLMTYLPLIILVGYFIINLSTRKLLKLPVTLIAILIMFVAIWNGERIRESIRKPYVISKYMYSSQTIAEGVPAKNTKAEISKFNENGLLESSPVIPENIKNFDKTNIREAGRVLALYECSSCHTLDSRGLRPLPKMVKRTGIKNKKEFETFLRVIKGYQFMPPFLGTNREKKTLAAYLESLTENKNDG